MRTLVFEPEARDKVMVEIRDDGSVTIAFKVGHRWGMKWSPTIDDDGDHLRDSESLPVISDDEYAKYLNGESM